MTDERRDILAGDNEAPSRLTSRNGGRDGASKVGAVLVVGGGIGGMQASLDLANSGFKVYLVESAPAIGGTMAQLDKTFPTNDCAMCILSPKLVETGRHLNIDILTMTDVEAVRGQAGNFTVTVRQRSRYIDIAKCTGCGDCATTCPITLPDQFNANLANRKATYKLYPQATPNAFAIEKRGTAPCRDACPAGQRAQGYIALIREKRYADAYRVIKEDNPFPAICGRICNHRCEDVCSRGQADQPLAIAALKRFVADYMWARERGSRGAGEQGERKLYPDQRVAIVGSGPAGLTAAQDLVRLGYAVTVYEALPVAGGMLRVGVPSYRLPRDLVQWEIDDILAQGVELKLNSRVDDVEQLFAAGYQAIFLAVGAHVGRKLPIPGADLPQVLLNTDFLRQVALAEGPGEQGMSSHPLITGRRVLVLGGGNVAMDVARTARRLGAAEVHMACLESREKMPAHDWEIAEAEEEDIVLYPARTFKEITSQDEAPSCLTSRNGGHDGASDGRVTGVRCVEVNFRGFDANGRPDMDELPGTEHVLPADTVIFAIGQGVDTKLLGGATDLLSRRRTIAVDEETLQTGRPGLFAGGDAVTGTTFVIDAIAAGHKAAVSIDRYLRGEDLRAPRLTKLPKVELSPQEIADKLASGTVNRQGRAELRNRPVAERVADFGEVSIVLSEEEALAEAQRCLTCGTCAECLECVRACQAKAIDHLMPEQQVELNVGAVILAPGARPADPTYKGEYGYGRYPNVLTSIEFERMLSASGPWEGHLTRPSDGKEPVKIAFLQCVGSREQPPGEQGSEGAEERGRQGEGEKESKGAEEQGSVLPGTPASLRPGTSAPPHPCTLAPQRICSSVCCMYATKEAVIAREHAAGVQPTVFYLDMRAFGKDFDKYVERAEKEHGVRFVRCFVSAVKQRQKTKNLALTYLDEQGQRHTEEFDLVVLSVGLRPTLQAQETARRLGVDLRPDGYCQTMEFAPSATSVPGIFVAGAFRGPKDIPETVVEASAAAAQAAALLAPARGTLTRVKEYPLERDVQNEEERVGVFVCRCGINIAGTVDVPAVAEFTKSLPGVAYAEENLYTCSQDTQAKIRAKVLEHNLNRVVVASCTPRTHESLFQDTIREAGLNPYLFEMTNIREQDSWVHKAEPAVATEKAKELIAMAVAKARLRRPIYRQKFDLAHSALVIGGGLSGMTAALNLAEQGFEVYLVEKSGELGGHLRHIYYTLHGSDTQALLSETIRRIALNERIHVYTKATVQEVGGYVGKYRSTLLLDRDGQEVRLDLEHGVIIVATGAQKAVPTSYLYGQDGRVVTQHELEAMLATTTRSDAQSTLPESASSLITQASYLIPPASPTVVMIQCVESRDEKRPYCSRICCSQAIKNALKIKEQNPNANVFVLYRDIRTYGFKEEYYLQARQAGVVFLHYEPEHKPVVRAPAGAGGPLAPIHHNQSNVSGLEVEVYTPYLGQNLVLPADLVVLSTGLVPNDDNEKIAKILKVPLNADGFFMEAHAKLRPLDFAADGLYLAGLAHSPKFIEDSILQAQGAAVRASTLLAQDRLEAPGIVAYVNERLCSGCGVCTLVCPYDARRINEEKRISEVIEVLCQGCGACCVACPNGASQQRGFEKKQVLAMIDQAVA
jgi:heterodisulfide reductase subunit A-like polyferredoxin